MLITVRVLINDNQHFFTAEGSPKDCQTQINAFLGDGLFVERIVVIGEK